MIEDLRTALQALNAIATMALAIHGWLLRRQMANRQAIEQLAERMETIERRIERHEAKLDQAPGHEHLSELRDAIATMQGQIRHMSRSLDRIETYLLERER